MQPGISYSAEELAGDNARESNRFASGVALNASAEYYPSRSVEMGLTASDGYGPVNSFDPTAAADRLHVGLSPEERARLPVPRGLTDKLSRVIAINDSLLELRDQAATDRALGNMGDLAGAYRASGMSGATGDPLTFESAALAGPGLRAPENAFLRGLSGESRSVLEGPASFAENAGLFTRGLVTSPYTSLRGLFGEVKGQYVDAINLMTGAGDDYSPSSALLGSLRREGFGGTLLGMGRGVLSAPSQPVIDLLEGRYEQAGSGLSGTLATGLGIVGKFRGAQPGAGAGSTFIDFSVANDVAPGLYRADPRQLRFMQPTVSPNYSTGGHTIASTADDLRLGRVTPDQLGDPLRVVMIDGKPFSFDNRRVLSYNMADMRDVPIQVMGLDDPKFASKVDDRLNPIGGQGLRVVVVPSSERSAVMADLYRRGMIQRP